MSGSEEVRQETQLDEYTKHEMVDRLYFLRQYVTDFVTNHPAVSWAGDKDIQELLEIVEHLYQNVLIKHTDAKSEEKVGSKRDFEKTILPPFDEKVVEEAGQKVLNEEVYPIFKSEYDRLAEQAQAFREFKAMVNKLIDSHTK